MSKLAIVATIKTATGKRDEYLKHLRAHRILSDIRAKAMLPAIHFNHQPGVGAPEVNDVAPDRMLTAKAVAVQLRAPQLRPELALGPGHVSAQLSGARSLLRGMSEGRS